MPHSPKLLVVGSFFTGSLQRRVGPQSDVNNWSRPRKGTIASPSCVCYTSRASITSGQPRSPQVVRRCCSPHLCRRLTRQSLCQIPLSWSGRSVACSDREGREKVGCRWLWSVRVMEVQCAAVTHCCCLPANTWRWWMQMDDVT
jgi:hypothetical protein